MGNTSASLHVLKPALEIRNFDREIKAAYKQLGYGPARASTDTLKRVVLAEHGGNRAFISLHDSDNALIDSGELKQLAVILSKKLKTAAVVTSIYDSDSFEFIVFNKGKQVDAVVSDADDHTAGLKVLKAGKRTSTWKDIFFAPAAFRAMLSTDALAAGAATMTAILERERAFEERMQRVGKIEGAFAEDGLTACCEAAGLDVMNVLTRDPTEEADEPGASVLTFAKLAVAADQPAPERIATRAIKLASFISDDDWTAPKYYPAAWPFAENQRVAVRWLVTSADAGFSGLKLKIELPDAPVTLSGKLTVQALPFYNGQVTTANAIGLVELPAPPLSDGAWTFDIAPFVIPDLDPETRRQALLVFVLELGGTDGNVITFHPTLATTAPTVVELKLPSARLQRQTPTWVPKFADMTASAQAASVLQINAPTVFSMTALVEDGPTTLADVGAWAKAWLSALTGANDTALAIKTMKHMSASFRVAKSETTVPLEAATAHKAWSKLFDPKSDYQSVMLQVRGPGQPFPVAGFTWQAALRDGLRPDGDQALKHVRDTIAPYLRGSDHAHPLDNDAGSAVAVSAWMLNDPAVFEAMGTSPDRLAQMFEGWMAGRDPVHDRIAQAWITRAAWIPEFDVYESYHQTPYEIATGVDWFRSGLNGMLAQRMWACRRLRFLSPKMWLGRDLMTLIDTERLATVAELSHLGSATLVQLCPTHTLGDLEMALAPIIPKRPEG